MQKWAAKRTTSGMRQKRSNAIAGVPGSEQSSLCEPFPYPVNVCLNLKR
jgi:hypothetical protein